MTYTVHESFETSSTDPRDSAWVYTVCLDGEVVSEHTDRRDAELTAAGLNEIEAAA